MFCNKFPHSSSNLLCINYGPICYAGNQLVPSIGLMRWKLTTISTIDSRYPVLRIAYTQPNPHAWYVAVSQSAPVRRDTQDVEPVRLIHIPKPDGPEIEKYMYWFSYEIWLFGMSYSITSLLRGTICSILNLFSRNLEI